MTDALLPLLYISAGYLLALATIYATAICTRRLAGGQSLVPRLRKPTEDASPGYQPNYRGYTP